MPLDVLLGLQWGDEGKGKVVDVITSHYDIIARFQGGPNAGHTLEFNGIKHVLHTIPSGVFHENCINVVGNGVVIDPVVFSIEINKLRKLGVDVHSAIRISRKAHLILPTHLEIDKASEDAKGNTRIGSTLKGIGPTYMDKTGRNGLRTGDIESTHFKEKYDVLTKKHLEILSKFYNRQNDFSDYEKQWFEGIELIRSFEHIDSEIFINNALNEGKSVLAEGAQGTLLDIDFGSYPYVTSSNTICAGACTGLGVAPTKIGEVIGIFKAYCTRVGSGPFPTELTDDTGEAIRKAGNEFGSTTGRPRRCGWIDLPALKYAVMLNGVTNLVMTKADVLSQFDTIKVCTHYHRKGKLIDYMPYDINETLIPVYKDMKGWIKNIKELEKEDEMPEELVSYIRYLEDELKVPITMVSVGPDRKQILMLQTENA